MDKFIVKPNKTVAELIDISKKPVLYSDSRIENALKQRSLINPFSLGQEVDAIKSQQIPKPSESEYKDHLSFIDQ